MVFFLCWKILFLLQFSFKCNCPCMLGEYRWCRLVPVFHLSLMCTKIQLIFKPTFCSAFSIPCPRWGMYITHYRPMVVDSSGLFQSRKPVASPASIDLAVTLTLLTMVSMSMLIQLHVYIKYRSKFRRQPFMLVRTIACSPSSCLFCLACLRH